MENIFTDIGIIIIIATVLAYIIKLLKQPRIPAYILTGLIIGPLGLGLIKDYSVIRTLSEIGIAFMLFVVGMELDFRRLRDIGFVASVGGTIKSIILFIAAFLIAIYFGFKNIEAAYIGLILAFSSTMIVIKILSDKNEIETLHGRITIGILLIEDILAILVLSSLNSINNFDFYMLIFYLLKGIFLILLSYLIGITLFPKIFKHAAKSTEMLFLLAISTCFGFALLANYLEFSIAIGAFIAGITLSNLPYNLEIIAKVKPLRDFFATLFFVTLGMQLIINNFNLTFLIILILLVIIIKPLLIMLISSFFGYKRRTSFLTSISLTQISEFSLIIVSQGLLLGHISQNIFSITIFVAVITMSLSSYFIKYNYKLFYIFSKPLKVFDNISSGKREIPDKKKDNYNAILIGYDRIGYPIYETLKKLRKKTLIIDFNPEIIRNLMRQDIPCIYGDIGDPEIIDRLNFKKADIVISTVPTKRDNNLLINKVKRINKNTKVIVTAYSIEDALEFYKKKSDYVILPHFLGGDHVSILLEEATKNLNKLLKHKLRHIDELTKRKKLGYTHPKYNRHR